MCFLSAGQNLSHYKSHYRGLIDRFPVNLNTMNIDAYFKLVSDVKINIAHTPMELTDSDRYISDTVLAALKK